MCQSSKCPWPRCKRHQAWQAAKCSQESPTTPRSRSVCNGEGAKKKSRNVGRPKGLRTFMVLILLFLCEFHVRAGDETLTASEAMLKRALPSIYQKGLKKRRGTIYAMLDSTSLWCLIYFVYCLQGPLCIFNLVVAVVCMNHWSRLASVASTTGLALQTTALQFCRSRIATRHLVVGLSQHPRCSLHRHEPRGVQPRSADRMQNE